jgi:shikimate dehydrogenase
MFANATAQNMVYRLFDITPDDFRREALRLFASGVRGLNVTLPHKQAAAELVNELTPRAERAQAVNTIAYFDADSLLGDNTDGLGLTADLERNLGINLANKRVLILGAGGAVRGVLGPLLERELGELIIANRTADRARNLATVGLVGEQTICYDMAYGRGHTPFTLWAKSLHAARTTKGWGMLVEQAAESFLLWRGIRPDTQPVLQALAHYA